MILEPGEGEFHGRASQAFGNCPPRAQPNSPPPRGEGSGMGGTTTFDVLRSTPPCPSPAGGEGTLRPARRLTSTVSIAPECIARLRLTPTAPPPATAAPGR